MIWRADLARVASCWRALSCGSKFRATRWRASSRSQPSPAPFGVASESPVDLRISSSPRPLLPRGSGTRPENRLRLQRAPRCPLWVHVSRGRASPRSRRAHQIRAQARQNDFISTVGRLAKARKPRQNFRAASPRRRAFPEILGVPPGVMNQMHDFRTSHFRLIAFAMYA